MSTGTYAQKSKASRIREALLYLFLFFAVTVSAALRAVAGAAAAAAAALFHGAAPDAPRDDGAHGHDGQQKIVDQAHHTSPAIAYAANATTHATEHCRTTTPTVLSRESSSRRMVAMAATHGVYSSVNTRKLTAERVVSSDEMAAPPSSTCSVLTTDSLAMKPEMSAVAQRQSPKPSGRKMGARNCPMSASKLLALSATTFRRVSKLWRNQMMIVARKMTVNARWRKSFAFSQSSSATLLSPGMR